jgi:1-acyl-sn-glycerol-3-phosphate acyltransferase
VISEIERALDAGRGVVLFPEGTSSAGFEVGPFRPPLLEVAARAALPVSYAALSYRTGTDSPPAHLAISWWGDMEFSGHAWRLLELEGLTARLNFGGEPVQESDRKRLAERLRAAVASRFVPTASPARETAGEASDKARL